MSELFEDLKQRLEEVISLEHKIIKDNSVRVFQLNNGDIFQMSYESFFFDINTFNKIKNYVEIIGYSTVKDYWKIKWLWKKSIHIRIYKPFSKRKVVQLIWVGGD